MFNTKAIKATILFTAVCVFGWIAHGVQTLAQIEITNEVYTAAQTDAKIVELAPTPGDYSTVSNRAMNAVQSDELGSDIETLLNNGLIDYFNDWLPNELDLIDENYPRYYKINQPFYLTNETVRINVEDGSFKLNFEDLELSLEDFGFTMVGSLIVKNTSAVDSIWDLSRVIELYLPRYIYASVPGYDEYIDLWSLATKNDVLDIVNRTTFPSITDGTNTIDAAGNVFNATNVLSNWIQVQGPSGMYDVFWVEDPSDYQPYIDRQCWAIKSNEFNQFPLECTTNYYSTNFTVSAFVDGQQTLGDVSFVRTTEKTMNRIGKLALTDDIPPAVTVVAPSTNATVGTAADAKATGTALYTGFTEWEFSSIGGDIPAGTELSLAYDASDTRWVLTTILEGQTAYNYQVGQPDDTSVTFYIFGDPFITATRHLITPTKTSQLTNDGSNGVPFVTESQLQDNYLAKTGGVVRGAVTIYGGFAQGCADNTASGFCSHAEGTNTVASERFAHSEGFRTLASGVAAKASGLYSKSSGRSSIAIGANSDASNYVSFVWNGFDRGPTGVFYGSHGSSTFNVNPINGLYGFFLGEKTLEEVIAESILSPALVTNIVVAYDTGIEPSDDSTVPATSEVTVTYGTLRAAIATAVGETITNPMSQLGGMSLPEYISTVKKYEWDEARQVCYRRCISNDFIILTYATNIDLTAAENLSALKAYEDSIAVRRPPQVTSSYTVGYESASYSDKIIATGGDYVLEGSNLSGSSVSITYDVSGTPTTDTIPDSSITTTTDTITIASAALANARSNGGTVTFAIQTAYGSTTATAMVASVSP